MTKSNKKILVKFMKFIVIMLMDISLEVPRKGGLKVETIDRIVMQAGNMQSDIDKWAKEK